MDACWKEKEENQGPHCFQCSIWTFKGAKEEKVARSMFERVGIGFMPRMN